MPFRAEWQVLGIKYYVLRNILYTCFFTLASFNIIYYFNQYFIQLNYYTSKDWQYGYKEAVEYIKPIEKNYNKIIVSNKEPLDQSYMFFLFYLKFDPFEYQKSGGTASGGFAETHKGFSNFTFRPIEWGKEEKERVLFIGRPNDFPQDAKTLKTINYLNGEVAIKIVEGT